MSKQKPIEIITPPNALKAKIGGPLPALDQRAIARAEEALAKLSTQFNDWILDELERLLQAWAAYEVDPGGAAARADLHRRSHDLKGLAPTYGYPLVGRLCGSLCKLTGDEAVHTKPPTALLKAHVDAVRAAIRGRIMSTDHPVGLALANELEDQMKRFVDAS